MLTAGRNQLTQESFPLIKKRKVSGGTYRVHAVFHAYAGDKVETITDNSGKVKF